MSDECTKQARELFHCWVQAVEHHSKQTAQERLRHLWPLQILMRLMMTVINIITITLPEMTRDAGRHLTLIQNSG